LNTTCSIIVPSYNKVSFIEQTIQSVLAQTNPNWELILIDDNSTDGSQELLEKYSKADARIQIHFNAENKGGNYCRNQGLKLALGNYVIFLDGDDLLAPYCLEQRMKAIETNPLFDLWVFPMVTFFKTIGDHSTSNWIPPSNNCDFLALFIKHKLPWAICQPIWKREKLEELEGFNTSFIRLQDVELHTRALIKGLKVDTFPKEKIDCYYRIDGNRNVLNTYQFLTNFSKGSVQYYTTFFDSLSQKHKKHLVGSLLEPLSVVCYQLRKKKISRNEATILSESIINTCLIKRQKRWLSIYFFIERMIPFHPKGLKKIISIIL
jgi:glycosyltransferase involved in cell wall biosynthesis